MKKIIKLLFLIPTLTTPLTLISCKNKKPNIDEKKDEYSTENLLQIVEDLFFINKNKWDTNEGKNESTFRQYIYQILIGVPNAQNGDSLTTEKIIFNNIEKIIKIITKNKMLDIDEKNYIKEIKIKIEIIIKKINDDIWKENKRKYWGDPNEKDKD